MTTDAELLALAEKATPGPWTYWVWGGSAAPELHGLPCSFGVDESDDDADDYREGFTIADFEPCEHTENLDRVEQLANAKFIAAANPARIKALLGWKHDAMRVIDRWEKVADALGVGAEDACEPKDLGRLRFSLALERIKALLEEKAALEAREKVRLLDERRLICTDDARLKDSIRETIRSFEAAFCSAIERATTAESALAECRAVMRDAQWRVFADATKCVCCGGLYPDCHPDCRLAAQLKEKA